MKYNRTMIARRLLQGFCQALFAFLLSVSAASATDVRARLNSANGSTSFQVRDSNDAVVGRIDSDGHLLLMGSATVNNGFIVNGGNVGIGTQLPQTKFHLYSADGTTGPQMIISTGAVKLFEVNGASVALGVSLHFPDGTVQNTAFIANSAGVLTLSSMTSVGTITSTSAAIVGGVVAVMPSTFTHNVRISSLAVTGTITSTSAITAGAASFTSLSLTGPIIIDSMTSVGTITSTSAAIVGAVRATRPSTFTHTVQISSLSMVGSITSTSAITAGAAAFASITLGGGVTVDSMTSVGTITSTSAVIVAGVASSQSSDFLHNVRVASLTVTGTITSTSAIIGGTGSFSSLTSNGAVTVGSMTSVGTITSTSAAIVGGIFSSRPSTFSHTVQISSLAVIGTITSTSAIIAGPASFTTLTLNGPLMVASMTSVGTITSTSAVTVGAVQATRPSTFTHTVQISSLSVVGTITSTSAITAGAASFTSLTLNGVITVGSMTSVGTITSTSAAIVGGVQSLFPSTFTHQVRMSSLSVVGTITSTSAITGGAATFASLNLNGPFTVSSMTSLGTITSTSTAIVGSVLAAFPSTFTHTVRIASLTVVGTITSTSAITAGAANFASLTLNGPFTFSSMTSVGTITSTSAVIVGGVFASRPSTFTETVQISSLSVIGTITSTSAITAGSASFGALTFNGDIDFSSLTVLGTITSTSTAYLGAVQTVRPSTFSDIVLISSLSVIGTITSTSNAYVGAIQAARPSTFTHTVQISSLSVIGTITSTTGFVGGASSMTSLNVGANFSNFVVSPSGNVGIGTTLPRAKLEVSGPAASTAQQLIVSTGVTTLFEVTGASATVNTGLFTVKSTTTHFPNLVRFSTTVYITGPSGSAGNLLIVSTGTVGSSVRNVFLRVASTGTVSVHGKGAFGAGGADVAEMYPSDEKLEAGDVVISAGRGKVRRHRGGGESGPLLGIVSTSPGLVAGIEPGKNMEDMVGSHPIALTGRVPVKVTEENGPIRAGDLLTASTKIGYAAKAIKTGIVIGIALEDFKPAPSGFGKVLAFVNPHTWVNPRDYEDLEKRVIDLESKISKRKR